MNLALSYFYLEGANLIGFEYKNVVFLIGC